MKKHILSIAAVIACAALAPAAGSVKAQAPANSQPDRWMLHQASENCYLSRSFVSGGHKMDVLIESFGSQTPYHVIVRGAGLPLLPQRGEVARVGFGGRIASADTFVLVGKSGKEPMLLFAAQPPQREQVKILSSLYVGTGTKGLVAVGIDPLGETLSLEMTGMSPLSFPLGSMQSEYARLNGCAQALVAKWSAAASAGATPANPPKLLQAREAAWHMKYPENLLLNRVSGLAELRMTIGPKGRAHDCVVQISVWASRFGDNSCNALEEVAPFEPAHDAEGKPVSALYRTSALFVIWNW